MEALNIGGLKAKLPIIQGGMGICVSLSELASAVANEGGIGVISGVAIGMLEPDYKKNFKECNKIALRKEIRKARAKTDGVIGVNVMMALTDYEDLLNVAVEEKIDVVFVGAGLPLKMPFNLENTLTKFVPKVSSARAARVIFDYWLKKYNRVPDAIVVEGPRCGGHIGFKKDELENPENALDIIIRQTVTEIDQFQQKLGIEIPVIAAGGIYTGKDMYDIMQVGAKGVKMGTRFVTTTECDVSEEFKQNYIACKKEDITIIDSPVGLPGRVIMNDFVREIKLGNKKPINCAWQCLKTCNFKKVQYCVAEALFNAAKGDFTKGFSFAGSNAYLAERIMTVKETIEQIKQEYLQESLLLR